jgi:hypothetical protein
MREGNRDIKDILAELLESLLAKQSNSNTSLENTQHDLLKRTNIKVAIGRRNTEHGLTQIQTLTFAEANQRQKVLSLLDNPLLDKRVPHLLSYVYNMGCEANGEKRYFAASAVGALAVQLPFLDLKERIILPWAKDGQSGIREAAAHSLALVVNNEHCQADVLTLLKHWLTLSRLELIDTALLTYYYIAQSHPQETLDAIKAVLRRENVIAYPALVDGIIAVIDAVYALRPKEVLNSLYKWFVESKKTLFGWISGVLFLLIINPSDVAIEAQERKQVVEILFELWDNASIPNHLEMQQLTTLKIEEWAEEAITAKEDKQLFEVYCQVFYDLYQKYSMKKQNRLDFHLRRWQKNKDWERERALKLGKANQSKYERTGSFLDLIPPIASSSIA